MNSSWKGYFSILIYILIGLVFLVVGSKLHTDKTIGTCITFTIFILYNLIIVWVFKLKNDISEYWDIKKSPLLFAGAIAGLIYCAFPILVFYSTGGKADQVIVNKISLSSIGLVLIIVSWEELWFRGIFLNFATKYLSEVKISLFCGLLFMLLHVFNPKIDLITAGPELFFAGSVLTLIYFKFRNIFFPIGFHLGNNYLENLIEYPSDSLFLPLEIIKLIPLIPLFTYLILDIEKTGKEKVIS